MVWRPANQGPNDVGQLFGHPICGRLPTGNSWPEGVPVLCILGRS